MTDDQTANGLNRPIRMAASGQWRKLYLESLDRQVLHAYRPLGIHPGDSLSTATSVHVDQESDYKITFLAERFEDFVKGLLDVEQFADQDDDSSDEFVWATEDITASIRRDDEFLKIGQYLYLKQDLSSEETGWLNMKINIPEHWQVQNILVGNGLVRLETASSGSLSLTRDNVGKLSFDILDGGDNMPDDVLQSIWVRHASVGA